MKKPYNFTEMSKRRCAACGKAIKANVAERKADDKILICYKCSREVRALQHQV